MSDSDDSTTHNSSSAPDQSVADLARNITTLAKELRRIAFRPVRKFAGSNNDKKKGNKWHQYFEIKEEIVRNAGLISLLTGTTPQTEEQLSYLWPWVKEWDARSSIHFEVGRSRHPAMPFGHQSSVLLQSQSLSSLKAFMVEY